MIRNVNMMAVRTVDGGTGGGGDLTGLGGDQTRGGGAQSIEEG